MFYKWVNIYKKQRPQSNHKPPGLAKKFFYWYCNPRLRESIEGDLIERFEEHVQEKGLIRARIYYCINVLKFMNKYTFKKNNRSSKPNWVHLLINHFLTSSRYLKRHKFYASLNIFGLSVGIASFLLIYFFINHQLSFDKFHENGKNIYRLTNEYTFSNGDQFQLANSVPALAPEIPKVFPEFERVSRMRYAMRTLIRQGDQSYYEDYGYYADSVFLEIMSFDLLAGDSKTALDEPNSIVITEALARKYFGNSPPLGQILEINDQQSVKVTGILKSIPYNSHLNFHFLLSFSSYEVPDGYTSDLTSWTWAGFLTYAQLKPGSDTKQVNTKVNALMAERVNSPNVTITVDLQPLYDIYLNSSDRPDDLNSNLRSGSRFTVYALGVVSFLILLIASFNFMNLTMAISLNRTREMGIRKVLGAQRKILVGQLMSDAMLITFSALTLSALWIVLLTKSTGAILNWEFNLSPTMLASHLPAIFGGAILLALISGIYPAVLLSKINTIKALKGNLRNLSGGKVKYGLIALQFFISIGLLASTIVITKQLEHIQDQNLGLDQENVVVLRLLPSDMTRHYDVLKTKLLQESGILEVSRSERLVGDPWPSNSLRVDGASEAEMIEVTGNLVGYDYLNTLGIKIKEGRSFSKEFETDTLNSIILNESAVKHLGLDNPIGTKVQFFSSNGPRTVIGVMEDFNFSTLHNEIGPAVLVMPFIDLEFAMIRLAPGDLRSKLDIIESTWKDVAPGVPLDLKFMDNHLESLYQSEEELSKLITSFSGLGVLLACLGLYGMITFTVNNRIKEIGIRKILGANALSILRLLSRQYLATLSLGFFIALPIGFYVLNNWLNSFAYRIDLHLSYFILAGAILTILCLSVIGKKVQSTLKTNPATILRDE